jgi:histone deacetylase HOS3
MSQPPNTTLFLQDECYKHRYIRSKDVSFIVERPERLRALKVGFAAAIARLEEARGPTTTSLAEGSDNSKGPVDAADELTRALDNLNIAPKLPATLTDICDISLLPVTLQYLSSDPAVRMIHAANADGDGYDNMEHLDRLAKWARESEEKIKETGSEIPVGFSQGDLYSKLRYILQPLAIRHRMDSSTILFHSVSTIVYCNMWSR